MYLQGEDITVKATAIFFSLLGLAILGLLAAFAYKRYKANRSGLPPFIETLWFL
jgi:LPXTG-motif cell wall-anchored protein